MSDSTTPDAWVQLPSEAALRPLPLPRRQNGYDFGEALRQQ